MDPPRCSQAISLNRYAKDLQPHVLARGLRICKRLNFGEKLEALVMDVETDTREMVTKSLESEW